MEGEQPEHHGDLPHPGAALDHAKDGVGAVHSRTLHLQNYIYNQTKEALRTSAKPMRVLIAEPNTDMQMLYRRYLDSLGLQVTIAERQRVPRIRL